MPVETRSNAQRGRLERGGVAVLVAILLGGGVLVGMSALAIDVGNMMFERRQLQNGADAASSKLASICSGRIGDCNDAATAGVLDDLINKNAGDNFGALDKSHYAQGQCGRVPTGASMPACDVAGSFSELVKCPPVPDWLASATNIPYVETYTRTETASGGQRLLPFLRQGSGTEVRSCARAAWGPPKKAVTLPLTFSYCEYEDAIARVGFGNNPIDSTKPYKGETALALKYKVTGHSTTDPCVALGHSGMDAPGGFGWLDQTACEATIDDNGWVPVDTGKSGPLPCITSGQVVYIPIFNCVSKLKVDCDNTSGGSNTNYEIDGFAAFYVTAIKDLPGHGDTAVPGYPGTLADTECKNEANGGKGCLYGWFLDKYVKFGGEIDPGGTSYGADLIVPAG
jgi:hypothetical protein